MKHLIFFIFILAILSGCVTKPSVAESDELDKAVEYLLECNSSLEEFVRTFTGFPEFAETVGTLCSPDEKQKVIDPFIEQTQWMLSFARLIMDSADAFIRIRDSYKHDKDPVNTSDLLAVFQQYKISYHWWLINSGDYYDKYYEDFADICKRLLQSLPSPQ
jgi:hypothetical protein